MIRKRGVPIYFNWQSLNEIEQLYAKMEFELLGMSPIGMFSGYGNDAMSRITNPETISESKRKLLLELETTRIDDYLSSGRYTLVVTRKL